MHKPVEEMTLRDLMDRMDEIKLDRLRQDEMRRKEQRASNHLLSLDDLAEYFGADTSGIKLTTRTGDNLVYFREIDLRA